MRKKILGATFVVAMMAVAWYNVYLSQTKYEMSELALANVEALAQGEPVEWWDFFNNYEEVERIPINSSTCTSGSISYRGIQLSVESCSKYTYAIYHHCYDGGKREECTSSHLHEYI